MRAVSILKIWWWSHKMPNFSQQYFLHEAAAEPFTRRPSFWRRGWRSLTTRADLPHDVRDEEITFIVLFRLSVLLNQVCGGQPDMTFSARTYQSQLAAPHWVMAVVWRAIRFQIDLFCSLTRGEAHHCEAAWHNHMARDRDAG
jgi:hypothetical protein